ncbi:MAG TPA: sigma-70 family RNA polymerase sigma factor [Methylomirabilota bacterium]|nr:sigma-70 family RNA polymerase sigma factor [Methylomirabilota bacterium]
MKSGDTALAAFRTTHWTQVLEAADPQASSNNAAFADLYLTYWHPLYAFARRRGFSASEAEDLIQDFFTRLVSKQSLSDLQREGGRFRSFLLKSLDNFLANEWDRARAQKRGNGHPLLSFNGLEAEAHLALNVPDKETPESLFEKRWAFAVLAQATNRLRAEYLEDGRKELFDQFRVYLQGDRAGPSYAAVALQRGMSEGSVAVAVHRLRQRYGQLLREEIMRTVASPAEVDAELQHLIQIVGS